MSSLKMVGLAALLFLVAGSGRADDVTLDFSGTVNLSSVGGSADSTFSGSITWDPSSIPVSTTSSPGYEEATYTPAAFSFTLNSTDITASTYMPQIFVGEYTGVISFFDFGFSAAGVYLGTVGFTNEYLSGFGGNLEVPPGVLTVSLPSSLNFLGSVTTADDEWFTGPCYSGCPVNPDIYGTLTTPAPEPGTSGLLIIGLGLVLVIKKRISQGFHHAT